MQKRAIQLVCACLALLMATTICLPLFTSAASEATNKYNELQQQLNAINSEISNTKNEKDKTKKQQAQLNNQVSIIKQQITLLMQDIEEKQAQIVQKQEELDTKKLEIRDSEDMFAERLRANYIQRNQGTLSTLLGVTSFSELLTAADALQRVTVAENDLLQELADQKAAIEAAQTVLDEEMAALEAQEVSLDAKKEELAAKLQISNANLSQLDATLEEQQSEYDEIYKQYVAAKAAMEEEWKNSLGGEYVGGEFSWPIPNFYNISSPYGYRPNPFNPNVQEFHTGIDIAGGGIKGAPIRAANAGTVVRASYSSYGYGNCVMIDHGGGYKTLYAHCQSLAVSVGDYVAKDQVIGYVGTSGNSTGYHCHFEIRINGSHTNPVPYLKG